MVTPTWPCNSAVSARVKPTTPNLDAEYAVASLSARNPRVEATVTTLPCRDMRSGRAARTTATVPRRLTWMTFSQESASMLSRRPHASVPAQGNDGVEASEPLGRIRDRGLGRPAIGEVDGDALVPVGSGCPVEDDRTPALAGHRLDHCGAQSGRPSRHENVAG